MIRELRQRENTVKPVYVEHVVEDVDNWFLKLVLYNLNEYIYKNHLSTYLRQV